MCPADFSASASPATWERRTAFGLSCSCCPNADFPAGNNHLVHLKLATALQVVVYTAWSCNESAPVIKTDARPGQGCECELLDRSNLLMIVNSLIMCLTSNVALKIASTISTACYLTHSAASAFQHEPKGNWQQQTMYTWWRCQTCRMCCRRHALLLCMSGLLQT